jgi:hypothetical protein
MMSAFTSLGLFSSSFSDVDARESLRAPSESSSLFFFTSGFF